MRAVMPAAGANDAEAGTLPPTESLLLELGHALHQVGLPSHRLEESLLLAAQRLGIPLQVFALPTRLLLSFVRGGSPATFVLRTQPSAVHLERLHQLTSVADDVIRGTTTSTVARVCIEKIMTTPARWGPTATVAAYVFSAGAFAVFFGGGPVELLVSLFVGLTV